MQINTLNCCGGIELIGMNDQTWTAERYLTYYARHYSLNNAPKGGKAFVTFSYAWDVGREGSGDRTYTQGKERIKELKALIEKNNLGEIYIMAKGAYNPNYGTSRRIKAGIFVPNNKAISEFVIDQGWLPKPTNAWSY